MQISSPEYYAKVLPISGSAFDLEDAGIQFTEVLRIPTQDNHGSFDIALRNVINPQNAHLASDYNQIDYEQRVEIYDNPDRSGCPVFAGVVTEPPSGDLTTTSIKGEDSTRRLETRRLRRYQTINKNAASAAADMLKTYDVVFKDDFNRTTGFGANWEVSPSGGWTIVSNEAAASAGVSANLYATPVGYVDANKDILAANWNDAKISFDLKAPTDTWLEIPFQKITGDAVTSYYKLRMDNVTGTAATSGELNFILYGEPGDVVLASRVLLVDAGQFSHYDLYSTIEGTNRRVIFTCNNVEVFNVLDTRGTLNHVGYFAFVCNALSANVTVDNFIFANTAPTLTVGNIDTTSSTFNQVLNAHSQRAVLNQIADTLGWDYRVNAGSGSSNDTLDFGASVGRDLSDVIVLEEGKNIVQVQKHRTNQDLATWLNVYGQSQDDITGNFSSVDINKFSTYGIVETDYHDPRIIDVATAKLLGDQRLAIVSAGNVSLSGTILDESILFTQDPRWGYFVWGDMIYGGRQKLRPGDQVWMKVPRLNIDRKVTIVSLRRTGGTNAVEIIFDYFPWRKTDAYKETMRQLAALQIALANLMNAQGVHLILSGTTAQTWSFYLRGNQITNVYVDVTSNAWAGAVTVTIDGTDRTNALFGSATLTANAFANDTTYLVLSDVHTITITPTQTVTVDISIKTKVLS